MHFNCTFKRILLLWFHTFIIILIAWAIIICQFRNERETTKNTRLGVCIFGTNNFLLITPILMTIFHIGLEKYVIQQLNIFYAFSKARPLSWGDLYVENNTFKFSFHLKTQGNRSEFSKFKCEVDSTGETWVKNKIQNMTQRTSTFVYHF